MGKIKIGFQIDNEIWLSFLGYVTKKYGTQKKMSLETEKAISEYLEKR